VQSAGESGPVDSNDYSLIKFVHFMLFENIIQGPMLLQIQPSYCRDGNHNFYSYPLKTINIL